MTEEMHEGQLTVDSALARELVSATFSQFADLPARQLAGAGTVNAIFRIGDETAARFPLESTDAGAIEAEAAALIELGSHSPVPVPIPIGVGAASARYPSAWSVQSWVSGETATPDGLAGSTAFARDVAALITALRSADTRGRAFDGQGRGGDLPDHDEWLALCFERSAHLFDAARAAALWRMLRELPRSGPDVMSHRDLTPPNLLISGDRLVGLLDGGSFGPADPALDLVAAWHLFDAPARSVVRDDVGADDTEWLRGAAWALQQAMGLGWYYEHSNPVMSALGVSTMNRLLEDETLARSARGF